jgi:hypothetical protein
LGDDKIKILVCGLTNVAVDRILMLLLEQGFQDFARIGSLKKISKPILRYTHYSASNKKASDKDAIHELESML